MLLLQVTSCTGTLPASAYSETEPKVYAPWSQSKHIAKAAFTMMYVKMCTSMGSADVAALSCGCMEPSSEKPCEPSFKAIGRLKVRKSSDMSNSNLSVNFIY